MNDFIQLLLQEDDLERARLQRNNRKWSVETVMNLTVYINKMKNFRIGPGGQMPAQVLINKAIVSLQNDLHLQTTCGFLDVWHTTKKMAMQTTLNKVS